MRDFIEQNESDPRDKFDFDALLKQLRRAKKDPFALSRCIQLPIAEKNISSMSVNLQEIIQSVGNYYKIKSKNLLCPRPTVKNVARDLCILLAREAGGMPMKRIWAMRFPSDGLQLAMSSHV